MTTQAKTALTCGECKDWGEAKMKCPGSGFCGRAAASTFKVREVPLSCYFLPAFHVCPLPKQ